VRSQPSDAAKKVVTHFEGPSKQAKKTEGRPGYSHKKIVCEQGRGVWPVLLLSKGCDAKGILSVLFRGEQIGLRGDQTKPSHNAIHLKKKPVKGGTGDWRKTMGHTT